MVRVRALRKPPACTYVTAEVASAGDRLAAFSEGKPVATPGSVRSGPFPEHALEPRGRRTGRGAPNQEPCQYIRGQGKLLRVRGTQALRRFSAADLPVLRSATTSKRLVCPSLRLCMPARSTALMCTKTSLPPSSG